MAADMFLKLDDVKGESKDGLGSLIAAGIFVALALMPAQADAATIPEEIATLQAQVSALQSAISTLRTNDSALLNKVNTLQTEVGSLQTSNTALQSQVITQQNKWTVAQPVLALAPFVSVYPNKENGVIGPNIVFKGANMHIISGLGATDDNQNFSGLGNLIIGYDEEANEVDRFGSHNLVIGRDRRWSRVAATRDLPTIAFFRAGVLLRRSVPVPGILATHRPGAIMDKSGRQFVARSVRGGKRPLESQEQTKHSIIN